MIASLIPTEQQRPTYVNFSSVVHRHAHEQFDVVAGEHVCAPGHERRVHRSCELIVGDVGRAPRVTVGRRMRVHASGGAGCSPVSRLLPVGGVLLHMCDDGMKYERVNNHGEAV